jgi:hypothetical protein
MIEALQISGETSVEATGSIEESRVAYDSLKEKGSLLHQGFSEIALPELSDTGIDADEEQGSDPSSVNYLY